MSRSGEETRPSVISSIFGVVGRELQQFVLSAAGVNPTVETPISRSNSPQKSRSKRKAPPVAHEEESDRRPRKRARTSSPETMVQHRRRHESPEEGRLSDDTQMSPPAQPSSYMRPDYAGDPELSSEDGTRSPTPVRRQRATSKMPGALFSPSPEPETDSQEERRVRFASDVISPPLQRSTSRPPPPERERPKPRHTEDIPTRFKRQHSQSTIGHYSDTSFATPPPSTTDSEDLAASQNEPRFESTLRYSSYAGSSFPSTQAPSFHQSSLPTHSRTSSLASQSFHERGVAGQGRVARDDSFSFGSASERSMEQERISALEEEVRKLKEELALRTSNAPPPPPPPPPPPMLQPSRIPSELPNKGSSSLLTSARASLKATPGVPAPYINPSANMKSTVVPATQMVAFLNEMKTVRLRKVSSKPDMREGTTGNGRGPLPLKSSVLDKLGSSSSFSMPRQRQALSQDSVSTQSVGSSFAPSDLSSIHSSQTSNGTTRISELRSNRAADPTSSLVLDNVDIADEEHAPSTPPSATQRHSLPVSKSIPSSKTSRIPKSSNAPEAESSRHLSTSRDSNTAGPSEPARSPSKTSRSNAFPNRPTTSGPLPSLSPEKPRPPGRGRTTNTDTNRKVDQRRVIEVSSDEDNDPLTLLAPRHPVEYSVPIRDDGQRARRSASMSTSQSHSQPQTQSRPRSRSRSRSRAPTPSASTSGNVPSLEAELRKVVRAEVEREFEQEIYDMDVRAGAVLSGNGERDSQQGGFMAGGGAGGPPVWMRNGSGDEYVERHGGERHDPDRVREEGTLRSGRALATRSRPRG